MRITPFVSGRAQALRPGAPLYGVTGRLAPFRYDVHCSVVSGRAQALRPGAPLYGVTGRLAPFRYDAYYSHC